MKNNLTTLKQKLSLKKNSNLLSTTFLILASVFLLSGCQSKTKPLDQPTVIPIPVIDKSLRTKCSEIKEIPSNKSKDIAIWINEEVVQHNKCIIKQSALVDAVDEMYK